MLHHNHWRVVTFVEPQDGIQRESEWGLASTVAAETTNFKELGSRIGTVTSSESTDCKFLLNPFYELSIFACTQGIHLLELLNCVCHMQMDLNLNGISDFVVSFAFCW